MVKYKNLSNEQEKKNLVDLCEHSFEAQLDRASEEISSDEEINYITLSGPSCSGKTTTANKLISDFTALGRQVYVVSFDDFFKPHAELGTIVGSDGRERPDYDSVNAINLELLHDTLEDIFAHRDVYVPVYNFEAGCATEYRFLDLSPGNFVIFEGIQAVYPEIVKLFSEHRYKSIYISVEDGLEIGGQPFEGREIRLLRRIVRDFKFRGAEPDFTCYLWQGVRDNEIKNMEPYAHLSDIKINSLMPYEPGIIKADLTKTLAHIDVNGPYYEFARKILKCFESVEEISKEYLPKISVYHEFIG